MSKQNDIKNTYENRQIKFLERHNDLMKNKNSEIEQKLWNIELLLFHKNYVISNQTQEIKELKAAIGEMENANSIRLARYIKSKLLSIVNKNNRIEKGTKTVTYSLEKNIAAMQEQIRKIENDEKAGKFERLLIRQLPNSNLLELYKMLEHFIVL